MKVTQEELLAGYLLASLPVPISAFAQISLLAKCPDVVSGISQQTACESRGRRVGVQVGDRAPVRNGWEGHREIRVHPSRMVTDHSRGTSPDLRKMVHIK